MRIAKLLIPLHLPVGYYGQTPTPHGSYKFDRYEKSLAMLTPLVLKDSTVQRLHGDVVANRFVTQEMLVTYDIAVDPDKITLGEIVAKTLKDFSLEKLLVLMDGDLEEFDADKAAEYLEGVHRWSPAPEDF